MANVKPPDTCPRPPVLRTLPAGLALARIHRAAYDATAFSPVLSHQYYGGGRFDATVDDHYTYVYCGETAETAIAEAMLRDLPIDPTAGARLLATAAIAGRRISAVATTAAIAVVDLSTGPGLGAVAQDTWLTTCDPGDYAQTRHWGHRIRTWAPPAAAGFCWMSKREPGARCYVLFGDRCPPDLLEPSTLIGVPTDDRADFDTALGRRWLRARLSDYGVTLTRRRTPPGA